MRNANQQSKKKKLMATTGGGCDCTGQAGGVMFFCEDGVCTPIQPPTGNTGDKFVLSVVVGQNSNLPAWQNLQTLLNAIQPPPPGPAGAAPKKKR